MNSFAGYDMRDLGKAGIAYGELHAKYQDALETIMHYERRIRELSRELEGYEEAYEELSIKYYG